jgi:hypothetical protein
VTYLAYLAALDREERTARELEQLWSQVSDGQDAPVAKTHTVSE